MTESKLTAETQSATNITFSQNKDSLQAKNNATVDLNSEYAFFQFVRLVVYDLKFITKHSYVKFKT